MFPAATVAHDFARAFVLSPEHAASLLQRECERNVDTLKLCFLLLAGHQTVDERAEGRTLVRNGVGFDVTDAAEGTPAAGKGPEDCHSTGKPSRSVIELLTPDEKQMNTGFTETDDATQTISRSSSGIYKWQ